MERKQKQNPSNRPWVASDKKHPTTHNQRNRQSCFSEEDPKTREILFVVFFIYFCENKEG